MVDGKKMERDRPYLQARKIVKQFPGTLALNELEFAVRKAEVHAVVGENGAGKSTLMKILSGVYQKTSGQIYIDNEEIENIFDILERENPDL